MSILNITNLVDNPEATIKYKYKDAFEELTKELGISVDSKIEREFNDFVRGQIEALEEYMEESKGSELLGIIDNYLVNLDYYSEVKEWYENK